MDPMGPDDVLPPPVSNTPNNSSLRNRLVQRKWWLVAIGATLVTIAVVLSIVALVSVIKSENNMPEEDLPRCNRLDDFGGERFHPPTFDDLHPTCSLVKVEVDDKDNVWFCFDISGIQTAEMLGVGPEAMERALAGALHRMVQEAYAKHPDAKWGDDILRWTDLPGGTGLPGGTSLPGDTSLPGGTGLPDGTGLLDGTGMLGGTGLPDDVLVSGIRRPGAQLRGPRAPSLRA